MMRNIWKYINKTNESAESIIDTTPAEDFGYIADAVIAKQDELDILYAESVVKEIEAEEEKKAKESLNKMNEIIGSLIQQGASPEQISNVRKRLF